MKRHRVAVVGCGALAQGSHLPNAQKNPRIQLVSTCDIDAAVAADCRDRFGAERSDTDWHAVVEAPDIDMIILATQHDIRGEVIIPALKAGKPVYTEKPLAPSRKDMVNIFDAFLETGQPVCVGHNRRSSPAIIEFKRLLDKTLALEQAPPPSVDRLKEHHLWIAENSALQMLMRINDDNRSWKKWVYQDQEGILFAEMVHFIDLALLFHPSHLVRVFVEGSIRGNFTVVLRFADGSITTLQHSLVGHFDYPKELFEASVNYVTIAMDQHIEIRQTGLLDEPMLQTFPYAPDTTWAKEQGMTGYMRELDAELQRAKAAGESPRTLNVIKGHDEHMNRFLDHLEGRGPNPCDIKSAIAVNLITLRLLESARSGYPLAIGPEDWNLPE